jgi:putative transposase
VASGRSLEPEDRTLAMNAIRFWDRKKWFVYVAVVMSDHIHVVARPLTLRPGETETETYDLAEILQSVKGYSAKAINCRHAREGRLWQDERFDRIMRDDREFEDTWNYIRNNPVTAGLVRLPEEWAWLYESDSTD